MKRLALVVEFVFCVFGVAVAVGLLSLWAGLTWKERTR